ncbi:hypothetical protein C1T31_07885 [Hanstruepera neustonica]|uniref:DUF4412 domain-containing protein n=1 Tax=Hanstruepera neustonica TaxID=1445657 RepID=A0A2K1DZF8_9FLAO|nr:hypothetical protein [Hanstruepera neustonica]PNQ73422.1 hypothetical protein C1T31_07885 [Hanstruepera neustonica]
MKKILFVLVCVLSLSSFAQEAITEGIAKSKQTMSSDNEQMQAQLAMIGEVLTTTYFKDNKTRSETFNLMSGNSITIMNADTKEMLIMMDNQMVGKKYMTKSMEPGEEDMKDVTIEKGDETKTVLGYECQEYNLTVSKDGAEVKMDMFVTDKISAISNQAVQMGTKVEGFPLYMEMTMSQMGMNIKITHEVTEIKKETVSDEKFEMTPEEGYEKTDKLMGF